MIISSSIRKANFIMMLLGMIASLNMQYTRREKRRFVLLLSLLQATEQQMSAVTKEKRGYLSL